MSMSGGSPERIVVRESDNFVWDPGSMAWVKETQPAGGGGGGAVTIADGADIAEGATTDVAVTGDNPGSVSAKLRGLSKILADVWDSTNHWLQTTPKYPSTTASGTLTAAAQTVTLTVTGLSTVTVTVAQGGLWTGQVLFYASVDGTDYHLIEGFQEPYLAQGYLPLYFMNGSNNEQTLRFPVTGYKTFQVYSSVSGGSAVTTITGSTLPFVQPANATTVLRSGDGGSIIGKTLTISQGSAQVYLCDASNGAALSDTQVVTDALSQPTYLLNTLSFSMGYNGATWDRLRSTITNGLQVDVTRVQGTVSLVANQSVNVNQVAGVGTATGNGVTNTGTQRVTISSDSTGQVALASGSNTIGSLTANQSVNVAQVNGTTTSTNAGAVGTGSQRVAVAQDSTTVAGSASLPTGSNVIGALTANQSVNVTQVGGTALTAPVAGAPPSPDSAIAVLVRNLQEDNAYTQELLNQIAQSLLTVTGSVQAQRAIVVQQSSAVNLNTSATQSGAWTVSASQSGSWSINVSQIGAVAVTTIASSSAPAAGASAMLEVAQAVHYPLPVVPTYLYGYGAISV